MRYSFVDRIRGRMVGLSTLLILVFASIVLLQNLNLLREVRMWRLRGSTTALQPGRKVTKIEGVQADGSLRRLKFPLQRTEHLLVLSISAHCDTCREVNPQFSALARNAKALGDWTVVWVSRSGLESTLQYATESGIELGDVLADPLHDTYQSLGLESTPQVAVLDKHGTIQGVWQGKQPWSEQQVLGVATRK